MIKNFKVFDGEMQSRGGVNRKKEKNRQAYYIAPLNHLLLLPSGPGRIQQELVV